MPPSRRPVVLLVQPSRDDGLEMYAEFLRYRGLAVIPVSNSRDALMLAPEADNVVTGMILDDPMRLLPRVHRCPTPRGAFSLLHTARRAC